MFLFNVPSVCQAILTGAGGGGQFVHWLVFADSTLLTSLDTICWQPKACIYKRCYLCGYQFFVFVFRILVLERSNSNGWPHSNQFLTSGANLPSKSGSPGRLSFGLFAEISNFRNNSLSKRENPCPVNIWILLL